MKTMKMIKGKKKQFYVVCLNETILNFNLVDKDILIFVQRKKNILIEITLDK